MVRLKRRRATSKGSFSRTRTLGMLVESFGQQWSRTAHKYNEPGAAAQERQLPNPLALAATARTRRRFATGPVERVPRLYWSDAGLRHRDFLRRNGRCAL